MRPAPRLRTGHASRRGRAPACESWPRRASSRSRTRSPRLPPPACAQASLRAAARMVSTGAHVNDVNEDKKQRARARRALARSGREPGQTGKAAMLRPARCLDRDSAWMAPLRVSPRQTARSEKPMTDSQQRYRVIEKLESGGMAEVFRAESEGLQGFRKQVAIKRVLPHLSSKKKFISMFLDEARLSAHLTHSNCVQVFDIGVGDNAYFIVMEFVDGANLKAIAESLRKSEREFPAPYVAF